MKVLQIHDKDLRFADDQAGICGERAGGMAVYLAHLERGLRDRGVATSAISFRVDPRDGAPRDGHYELEAFRYRLRPSVLSKIDRIIETEAPDVVHLHSMPTLHPLLVRRLTRARPVVWTFHDVGPVCFWGTRLTRADGNLCTRRFGLGCVTCGCYRPGSAGDVARVLTHRLALRAYRSVPAVLVPSAYMAQLFEAHGLAASRIEVVPLFSRFENEHAGDRADALRPAILFVGRLTREKGVVELIEALSRLRDGAWTARIAGDGPLRGEVERRVGELDLRGRVELLGEVGGSGLSAQYRACALVVMPSIAPESFGLVGAEAMSFGKPVVAFESGGVTEWLDDGVNGLLASHRDVDELSRQIGRLVEDAELREKMGAAGRRRLLEQFSLGRHLDRMTAAYESAIERWRR